MTWRPSVCNDGLRGVCKTPVKIMSILTQALGSAGTAKPHEGAPARAVGHGQGCQCCRLVGRLGCRESRIPAGTPASADHKHASNLMRCQLPARLHSKGRLLLLCRRTSTACRLHCSTMRPAWSFVRRRLHCQLAVCHTPSRGRVKPPWQLLMQLRCSTGLMTGPRSLATC